MSPRFSLPPAPRFCSASPSTLMLFHLLPLLLFEFLSPPPKTCPRCSSPSARTCRRCCCCCPCSGPSRAVVMEKFDGEKERKSCETFFSFFVDVVVVVKSLFSSFSLFLTWPPPLFWLPPPPWPQSRLPCVRRREKVFLKKKKKKKKERVSQKSF